MSCRVIPDLGVRPDTSRGDGLTELLRENISDYDERRKAAREPENATKIRTEFRGAIAASIHSGLATLYSIMTSENRTERLWKETTSLLNSTPLQKHNIYFGYSFHYTETGYQCSTGEPSLFEDKDTGMFETELCPFGWEMEFKFGLHFPERAGGLLYHLSRLSDAGAGTVDASFRFTAPLWDRWRIEGILAALDPDLFNELSSK